MRRRQMLAGLAATATTVGWPDPALADPVSAPDIGALALLDADITNAVPESTARLTRALTRAWTVYADTRYDELCSQLPAIMGAAEASWAQAAAGRDGLAAILAGSYQLASELSIKLGNDPVARVLADRALTVANASGDATMIAAASRSVAIAMRRSGQHEDAVALLIAAAQDLDADTVRAGPDVVAAYGSLLCTAAYSSAQHGNGSRALHLLGQATEAARRLDHTRSQGGLRFNATNVAIYKIGVFTALGESAAALHHASSVRPELLPNAERRARYCIDTARAWASHGKPDRAHQALRVAAQHAPQELRRPSVRALTSTLTGALTRRS
ncbi:hypothetical protein BDK92_2641 [Micromonospora pisi]|uniref:Uncharacterized protein n=1 Tax=Micromonospora pisi TaxID=589240 RepID=A0A495JH17_9ACTN|nr:XRE family transcriptional regulator [Micromonospora pisi]RKR88330.1 hypothetical protein BDK92_2641 [Micromonospora pisi]